MQESTQAGTIAEEPPGPDAEAAAAVRAAIVDDTARAYRLLVEFMDDPEQEPRLRAYCATEVLNRTAGRV